MATKDGDKQTPTNSSYSSNKWWAHISYSISATTATTQTIKVILYFNGANRNWGQVGKYVSGNIKINGDTVKSFSAGDQSWLFTNVDSHQVLVATKTISRTTSAQSIKVSGTVKVNSPSAYRNGNSSTASDTQTVKALQTLKITYNGNGATSPSGSSGTLETRTYYYNKNTFDSYGLPDYTGGTWNLTRTGHVATGFWTHSNYRISQTKTFSTTQALYKAATGTTWDGESNQTLTLKAEWEAKPIPVVNPTLSVTIKRVASANSTVFNPQGTYAYFKISYTHGKENNQAKGSTIKILSSSSTVLATIGPGASSTTPIERWFSGYSYETNYTFTVSITANFTQVSPVTITKNVNLAAIQYPIDLQVSNNNVFMGLMHVASNANSNYPITTGGIRIDGNLIINNHETQVGYIPSQVTVTGKTISYQTGTDPTMSGIPDAKITLPAGAWIIFYSVYIDCDTANKIIATGLVDITTSSGVYQVSRMTQHTANTGHIINNGALALSFSDSRTIQVYGYQNNKSGQTCNAYIKAIRIA